MYDHFLETVELDCLVERGVWGSRFFSRTVQTRSLSASIRQVLNFETAVALGLLCRFAGGTASQNFVPSKEMMTHGYADYGHSRLLSLQRKRIQYIPGNIFKDFSNVTVSCPDFTIVYCWSWNCLLNNSTHTHTLKQSSWWRIQIAYRIWT